MYSPSNRHVNKKLGVVEQSILGQCFGHLALWLPAREKENVCITTRPSISRFGFLPVPPVQGHTVHSTRRTEGPWSKSPAIQ